MILYVDFNCIRGIHYNYACVFWLYKYKHIDFTFTIIDPEAFFVKSKNTFDDHRPSYVNCKSTYSDSAAILPNCNFVFGYSVAVLLNCKTSFYFR